MALALRSTDWLTRRRLDELPDTLFFHARDKLAAALCKGAFKLHQALAEHAVKNGWGVEVIPYAQDCADICAAHDRHLHIFLEDRPLYAPNAFHSVPSYLRGFWYFDEIGSRNNSTQRLRKFDPRLVSESHAERFHARLVDQFIGRNFSKFEQAARQDGLIEPGAWVFFAQDFLRPRYHKHYMSVAQMIEAAIACKGDRPLYIKPHPNQTIDELVTLAQYHAPKLRVFVSQASIHDLLAASDCVLTLTSAVGFEAFLHKKPVVLAGQTDFGQNAITLTDPARLGGAIDASMARDWPHAKFLTWFLRQNCLEDHPKALPNLLERIHAKGIGLGDTGQGYY